MKNFVLCFLLFCSLGMMAKSPLDSAGVKMLNNHKFIIHKVNPKETWYALARRYNLSVDSIQFYNKNIQKLKSGELVLIPMQEFFNDSSILTNNQVDAAHANADAISHTVTLKHRVVKGETLNKIAALYGITPLDVFRWNGLRDGKVEPGQWLIVNAMAARPPYIAWNKNVDKADTGKFNLFQQSDAELIIETGLVIVSNQCASVCSKIPIAGRVVSLYNLDSRINLVTEVVQENKCQPLFDTDIILVVSPEWGKNLGITNDVKGRIQLTYPATN